MTEATTTVELFPEDLYAVYKLRAWDLSGALNLRSIKTPTLLNALASAMGFSDTHELKAYLDEMAGADVRTLDRDEPSRVTVDQANRVDGLIALQKLLREPEVHPFEEWERLKRAMVYFAQRLDLAPMQVLDAVAFAWCESANWAEHQAKIDATYGAHGFVPEGTEHVKVERSVSPGDTPRHLRRNRRHINSPRMASVA